MFSVTCVAPVNIALIKYWGKRHEELILPINDSISMTLSTNELCAKTTISASEGFQNNRMWLNGEEVPFEENPRLMRCLKEVHRLALANGCKKISPSWKIEISSHNNFPTAAGLASSAAGYACLVFALARLYEIPVNDELTTVARQGSGSACRSLYGGFVQWHRGALADGSDSVAKQLVPSDHWPNMHVLILVVNDLRKKTGSTQGMQRAVKTSDLIQHRVDTVVPARVEKLREAIQKRDFNTVAEITMKDSNQFHAIALDTYPPCLYMNGVSHAIISFVHSYNELMGGSQVAYTFDAGPNACLYVLEEHIPKLMYAIQKVFPNDLLDSKEYLRGLSVPKLTTEDIGYQNKIEQLGIEPKNSFKYIIHTKVGEGPRELKEDKS
ncbi:hypothetical protein KR009_007315 [Drosophila setifemur]|nr:hypothetical protein KR009_007315 [Drosophila setifemur]